MKAEWQDGLEKAKAAYRERDEPYGIQVQVPGDSADDAARLITPREAFRLWAYGELIHNDYAKQVRWEKLGPVGQGLVRQMGYDYMALLINQAVFIRRLITFGLVGPALEAPS